MPTDVGDARCDTCAAFTRAHDDETLGRVGDCALEVYAPPVRASSTCSRYRPKGASAAAERPRAAGEPRSGGSPRSPYPTRGPTPANEPRTPLPTEIDIDMDIDEFRRVLREVLSDELGVSNPELGARWQGGDLVLKPGREGTAEKTVPIETFFHKIIMVRDKLRVLEAKINANPALSTEDKLQLQSYITGCYGSMTTFNVLFADKSDQFGASKG